MGGFIRFGMKGGLIHLAALLHLRLGRNGKARYIFGVTCAAEKTGVDDEKLPASEKAGENSLDGRGR